MPDGATDPATDRLNALRGRLSIADGVPLIAVPVQSAAEADAVRAGGGLALGPMAADVPTTEPGRDDVIAFDAAHVAPQALRGAFPSAVLLDCGTGHDQDTVAALAGADVDGISIGSLGFGDNGGTPGERETAYALQRADRPVTPVVSGGLNAIRALGFFDNLGNGDVVMVVRRGVVDHLDGITAGVRSLIQAAQCAFDGGRLYDYARDHGDLARAFESFADDADVLYPGWRARLGV